MTFDQLPFAKQSEWIQLAQIAKAAGDPGDLFDIAEALYNSRK